MNENTPNKSPEPIEDNPIDVRKSLSRRRTVMGVIALSVAGLVGGINGLSGATEGDPCGPIDVCPPGSTTVPFTKPPTIPETSTSTSTTVAESSTTVPESSTTVPESSTTVAESSTTVPESSTTTIGTPQSHVPPVTFEVTPEPQKPTADGTPNADRTT